MKLSSKIEAILFFKAEPMSIKKLAQILDAKVDEVSAVIAELQSECAGRGLVVLETAGEYTLGTNPEMGGVIEELQKEELNKSLSKASLETLSIILYKNGASRAEIDYIRGVNSSFTLRALSVRGLVEKVTDPSDARKYLYKPTFELLSYMGVTDVSSLPDFDTVNSRINQVQESNTESADEQ